MTFQQVSSFLIKLVSDYLVYSKYIVHFFSPIFLYYGISNFLRQIIMGSDYDRLEKTYSVESKKVEALIKKCDFLIDNFNKQQSMLNSIVVELDRQKEALPPLPSIDWLRLVERIHDNPHFYVPVALFGGCVYILWVFWPSILKHIKNEELKKELLKEEQLKKVQKNQISSNPEESGPIATSSEMDIVSNEKQVDLFDNLSFFDFF